MGQTNINVHFLSENKSFSNGSFVTSVVILSNKYVLM